MFVIPILALGFFKWQFSEVWRTWSYLFIQSISIMYNSDSSLFSLNKERVENKSPSGWEQSAMLQILWQSRVSSAKQAILTWCVPCLSPDHMLAETRHQNKTLIAAGDCHRLKACSQRFPLFSPLSAPLCFLLVTCHFSIARSRIPLMESVFSSDVNSQCADSCFLERLESKDGI